MIISVTVMFAVSWLPIQVRHATDAFFYYLQHCQPLFTCLHVCAGDPPPEELLDVRGDGDEHLAADQLPRARLQQLLRQPHPLRAPLPAIPHRVQARLHLLLHTSVH